MEAILKNKNIIFLFLSWFFKNFLIMMPILTLFFIEKWLSMSEVMILQTLFSVLIVVLEVPSWYFADIFKRKYSLIIWSFVWFLWLLWYYFASWFWWFVAVELLLWVSASFISWADSAYLYDELLDKKQEKKFQQIWWQYESVLRFSEAIAAFISGFIAIISFKAVIIFQIVVWFLWFISTLFLKEHKKNIEKKDRLNIKEVFNFVLKENDKIKYLIWFSALLWSSTLIFVWLAQPYWKELWLPLAYFWIVWWILNLLVWIFALFAYKLEKYFSFRQIFVFFWICSFIFFLILAFTNNIYLALIVSSWFWIFRWLNGPIIKDYINKEVESKMRATVMSIKNLWFRIVFSILSPFIWYFADVYDLHTSLLVSAITFWIISWIFLILLLTSYDKKCEICVK